MHSRPLPHLCAAAVIAVAGACMPSSSRPSPIVRSWDYHAGRAEVWSAAVAALDGAGFSLEDSSAVRGTIVTGWRAFERGKEYTTCSEAVAGRVTLRFGTGVQGVRVTTVSEFRRMGNGDACPSSGELERALNAGILEGLSPSGHPNP